MNVFTGELSDSIARKFREVCYRLIGYEPGIAAAQ